MGLAISLVQCGASSGDARASVGGASELWPPQALLEGVGASNFALAPSGKAGLLHVAAASGRADVLQQLLERGLLEQGSNKAAERTRLKVVNQRDRRGRTPLMLACAAGSAACARLLLSAGADPAALAKDGASCLHVAAQQGAAAVLEVLLGDESRVLVAGGRRPPVLLRNAVFTSPYGNYKFVDGRPGHLLSPLHLAASNGHAEAAEVLMRRGASVAAPYSVLAGEEPAQWSPAVGPQPRAVAAGSGGAAVPRSTPLHLAAAKGHMEAALALLAGWASQPQGSRGADPRGMRNAKGQRPVNLARAAGHDALARMLSTRIPIHQLLNPPSLTALAAAALRQRLMSQLGSIASTAAAQQAQHAEAAGNCGGGGGACNSTTKDQLAFACPICLEAPAAGGQGCMVAAMGCHHAMCSACASLLCEAAAGATAPVRCPLCRAIVGGWAAVEQD